MLFLPVGQHTVRRLAQLFVAVGQGTGDHGQFVRVGADGLDVAPHGDQAVGGADEFRAEPFHHGLHAPVLPQEAVSPARAEVGQAQVGNRLQALHLLPQLGHGTGVQDLELELAHAVEHGTRAQLHQHGQGRHLPQHHFGPSAFEGKFVLAVALFQVVGRQAQTLEPLHEIGAEHLALAVEGVAAQPSGFATRQRQGAEVVQLLAQLALVDQLGQAHLGRPVDERKGHARIGELAPHRLAHQQLVEVRVDERPYYGVDLPTVGPDAGGDVGHGRAFRERAAAVMGCRQTGTLARPGCASGGWPSRRWRRRAARPRFARHSCPGRAAALRRRRPACAGAA